MVHLREVLRALREAGLTANPKKCVIGWVVVRCLGFHLGHGQVRPQIDKTAAFATCLRPKTKKEVRQFLGLAGYYRRFILNYSDLTSPLTDLTKKDVPDPEIARTNTVISETTVRVEDKKRHRVRKVFNLYLTQ